MSDSIHSLVLYLKYKFSFFCIDSVCNWMTLVINQKLWHPSYLVLTYSPEIGL